MWILVHYYQNTFTGLEFPNFTIFDPKKSDLKLFENVKKTLSPSRIQTHDIQIHS